MIDLLDIQLSDLLRQREEPIPAKRQPIHLLSVPWPWPWLMLEHGVPWVGFLDLEPSRNPRQPPRRRVPQCPDWLAGGLVAVRCITPADANLTATLDARGLLWPSCPDAWRGAVVAVARCLGHEMAGRNFPAPELAHWWPIGHPLAWCFSGVVPTEVMPVDGQHERVSALDPALLPDLRERYQLSVWGVWRYEPVR